MKTQQAPGCEDCGDPCFPCAGSEKTRRTRCTRCKALLCCHCYQEHKDSGEYCLVRMDNLRAERAS